MDGNARYVRNQIDLKDFSAGRAARAQSQYPSRGDSQLRRFAGGSAELIFDQGPGELFVCRVAGNYMNVDILASMEYGVEVLGAPLIMVSGTHELWSREGCTAV